MTNPVTMKRELALFRESRQAICIRTDRMFAILMVFQWLAGVAAAIWISPRTWLGATSHVHWHVWAALYLGGIICAFPFFLALRRPGWVLTRHTIAVAQMLASALLIHLTGGRIETHFHVFGSLAFLACYRDWRVMVTATVITALDHFGRGLFWPQSVFGVLNAGHWRWFEHAAWVLFEDAFLIISIRQSLLEMRDVAARRAGLEGMNAEIEQQVRQRTEDLQKVVGELRLQTSALEAAVNGVVITDKSGVIVWVNPAFSQITGYGASEVLGKNPRILKSALHDVSLYKDMWTMLLAAKVWRGELVNRRKDGRLYNAELCITPVVDQQGEIKNFVSIMQDISAKKQSEQHLALERDLLHALMDNLPDLICFKDRDLKFTRVNAPQAAMLGLKDAREAVGRPSEEFNGRNMSRQPLIEEQMVLAAGTCILDKREQLQMPNGNVIWVSSSKVPFRDQTGNIAGLVSVSRDITQRVKAEAGLEETSALLETLFDNVPESIYFKDRQSRLVRFSKSFKNNLRVEDTALLKGRKEFDFFAGDHALEAYEDEQNIMRTGTPIIGKLEKKTHVDGSINWSITTKMPWRDKDGNIIGTFGISKDVTDLKIAEQERERMRDQLQQSNKLEAVGQLAAGIAHEINTPTQYVIDNTGFVKRAFEQIMPILRDQRDFIASAMNSTPTAEQIAEAAKKIDGADLDYLAEQVPLAIAEALEGLERVATIVRATKEFSHPGSSDKTPSDINHAIESTVTVSRNEWKYVAEMDLDLGAGLPSVPCFLGEFNQCILNLIVNASHAIGDVIKEIPGGKGRITIQTRHEGDHAVIRVSDTGTGIPDSVRSRIFEPFFTTKDIGKGTGQGLTMAYGIIVKKHGGTLDFETEVGKGTTFKICLPLELKEGSIATSSADSEACEAGAENQPFQDSH